MDIQILNDKSIKLKSKNTTFVIDPSSSTPKTEADAIIFLDNSGTTDRVQSHRVIIKGPGEYEVSGAKVSGIRSGGDTVYLISADNLNLLVGKISALGNLSDFPEPHAVLLNSDATDDSLIAKIGSNVSIFYGDKKNEVLKELGKNASSISKYSITFEKLPQDPEVISLG